MSRTKKDGSLGVKKEESNFDGFEDFKVDSKAGVEIEEQESDTFSLTGDDVNNDVSKMQDKFAENQRKLEGIIKLDTEISVNKGKMKLLQEQYERLAHSSEPANNEMSSQRPTKDEYESNIVGKQSTIKEMQHIRQQYIDLAKKNNSLLSERTEKMRPLSIANAIKNSLNSVKENINNKLTIFQMGLGNVWAQVKVISEKLLHSVKECIAKILTPVATLGAIGSDVSTKAWDGVSAVAGKVKADITKLGGSIVSKFREFKTYCQEKSKETQETLRTGLNLPSSEEQRAEKYAKDGYEEIPDAPEYSETRPQ